MTKTTQTLPVETGGTDITRFNALRHGVLSRYTVLPWESTDEYRAVVEALVAEHGPQGPTEEHLVEEIAGILWRKRRLRLAEAAAHRRGLQGTLAAYRETVKAALAHLDIDGQEALEVELLKHEASCLLVSHDRSFVRNVGNRFWLIEKRRLVEVESPEAFFADVARNGA